MTIKRTPEKTTLLSVAQYQGLARPGEIVIDETTYQMYIANATGDLNIVGTGSGGNVTLTQIVNGASNVAIPLAGANIQVGVSGAPNVVNFAPTQVDFKANIIPVGDAVYSLGSPTAQFKDLYLSNSTLYLDLVPITMTANKLAVNGANVLTDDGTGNTPFTGNVAVAGNLTAGNIATPGNVTATGIQTSLGITAGGGVVTDTITSRTGSVTLNAIGTDQNITLNPSGAGSVDATGSRVSNVATPTQDADAVNKAYVDAVMSGLVVHQSVACATTSTLAGTYNPGVSGVGATFTTTTPISFLDNYALQLGDRVLIKNQVQSWENGIYTRTSTSVFTRVTDLDEPADFDRAYVFVGNGTLNGRTGWVQSGQVVTVGGSSVVFYQFNAAAAYTAGLGITLSGTAFSLTNTGVTPGTYGNSRSVATFTVDLQGRVTNVTNVAIDSNSANLTGTTLSSNITTSNLQSLGTLTALNVGGVSNLGPASNVKILGGTPGYVLTTVDGAGTLAWGPFPVPVAIANGVSNVDIPIGGGNIVFTAGTANPANVTAFGIVSANLTANANVTTSNLTVSAVTTLGSIGNVKITGGAPGDVIVTDGTGNLTFQAGGGGGGGWIIANGTSNVAVPTFSSNVKISVNGVADVVDIGVLGLSMPGTLTAGNALITGNLTVAGTTNYVNVATLQVSDPIIDLGGGPNGTPLTVNDGKDRGTQLTYFTTQQLRAFMGWDSSNAEFAFGSNVSNVNDVITFNSFGNVRGNVFLGDLSGGNVTVTTSADLGAVTGVKISGGSSGQFLQTDGFGTLTWATPPVGIPNSIANGTSSVTIPVAGAGVITTSNGYVISNYYSDAAGARTITLSGNVVFDTGIGNIDFTNAAIANLGAIGNLRLAGGTSGQLLSSNGSGGLQWINPTAGSFIANGFSNVTIPAVSGNVTIHSAGVKIIDANLDTIGIQNGVDLVLGTGNANFQAATKTYLGGNANVVITGGSAGQVLGTDGLGALSWVTMSGGGALANGTSNVSIPAVNNAVEVYSNGLQLATFWSDTVVRSTIIQERLSVFGNGVLSGGGNVNFGSGAFPLSYVDFNGTLDVRLGDVANITIDGGNPGEILSTDGAGGLSWITPGSGIANGTSNVTISTLNGNIDHYVDGNSAYHANTMGAGALFHNFYGNIQVFADTTGNVGISTTNLGADGNVDFIYASLVKLGDVANIRISNGAAGQVLTSNGSGGVSWTTVSAGTLANGTSNVSIPAINGNINLSAAGNANILIITGTGANVNGTLKVTGQSNLGAVGNVVITGGTSGQVLTTNGSGGLSWTTVSGGALANGTSNVSIPSTNGAVQVYSNGIYIASFDNDGTTSTSTFGGDVTFAGDNGLSNLRVGLVGPGQGFALADFTNTSNVSLGPVANVHITGGTNGQILTTDGSGGLSWTTPGSGGSIIANGTSNVTIPTASGSVTIHANGAPRIVVDGLGNTLIQSNVSMASPGGASFFDFGDSVTPWGRVNFGNTTVFNVPPLANWGMVGANGTAGQVLTTYGNGSLYWGATGGSLLSNGTSNVTISTVNGNIRAYVGGNLFQTWTYNSSSSTDEVQFNTPIVRANSGSYMLFDAAAQTWLGGPSQVVITGGTNGQVLSTNGSGALSWTTISAALIANGTSNVSIPTSSGAIDTFVNGTQVSRLNSTTLSLYDIDILPTANVQGNIGSSGYYWEYAHVHTGVFSNSVRTNGLVTDNITPFGGLGGNIGTTSDTYRNIYVGNVVGQKIVVPSGGTDITIVGGNLLPNANVTYNLGSPTQRWNSIYLSNNTIYLGDSALSIDANAGLTVDGNAVVIQNSTGNTVIEGNIVAPGEIVANGNIVTYGDMISFANLSVGGLANLGPVGNITIAGGSNGQVLTTDGSGGLSWTTVSGGGGSSNSISNGTSNVVILSADGSIVSVYNGNVISTLGETAGEYGLIVNGNIIARDVGGGGNDRGKIEARALVINGTANLIGASNVALGAVGNITITGGSNGQVLTTNGNGALSWTTVSGGGGSANSITTTNANGNITAYTSFQSAGPLQAWSFNVGANVPNSQSYTIMELTAIDVSGLTQASTFSANAGNVYIKTSASAGEGIMEITSENSLTLSAPNITLGTVANIHISGGTNGQVLTTDGAGNLSWNTVGGSSTINVTAVTGSSYNVLTTDQLLYVTYASATAITLPSTVVVGSQFTVKDGLGAARVGNAITVGVSGGTIDGAATAVIGAAYNSMTFVGVAANTYAII